jgi:hypothetical protein
MKSASFFKSVAIIAGASLLLACATAKPFEYHSGNEIPEGPGIFTKEKGDATLYSSEKAKEGTAVQNASPPPAAAAAPAVAPVDNSAEFQQFKQWQDEQKEFEAFQQWKQSPQNAGEYQEFQEWKRWKAYQQWQETQPKKQ